MSEHFPDVMWWVSAVELPALAGLFWMVWSGLREADAAVDAARRSAEQGLAQASEALAAFKLEVAKSYASTTAVKDVEKRLTQHLLRIETKLDQRAAQRLRL